MRPPSAVSDGDESRRRRASARTPRHHAKPTQVVKMILKIDDVIMSGAYA